MLIHTYLLFSQKDVPTMIAAQQPSCTPQPDSVDASIAAQQPSSTPRPDSVDASIAAQTSSSTRQPSGSVLTR